MRAKIYIITLAHGVMVVLALGSFGQGVENRIPASDNAVVSSDPEIDDIDFSEAEELVACDSSNASNRDRHSYLRFNISKVSGSSKVYSASLNLYVTRAEDKVGLRVLNDGYTDVTRKGETEWTSVLYGTNAPSAGASTLLAEYTFSSGGLVSVNLDANLMHTLLNEDTNNQLTIILESLWYNNYAQGVAWASLDNTGGHPVPTLVIRAPAKGTVIMIR